MENPLCTISKIFTVKFTLPCINVGIVVSRRLRHFALRKHMRPQQWIIRRQCGLFGALKCSKPEETTALYWNDYKFRISFSNRTFSLSDFHLSSVKIVAFQRVQVGYLFPSKFEWLVMQHKEVINGVAVSLSVENCSCTSVVFNPTLLFLAAFPSTTKPLWAWKYWVPINLLS